MEPILAPESIDLIALAPVIVLSVFAMMVLIVDLFGGRNKTLLVFISLVGLLMTAISAFAKNPIPAYSFNDSYIVDHLSLFFICIFTISSALAILLSVEYNEREGIRAGEYYALILFCTVGMILLASSTDMIMIFLGIEIVSICLYVLAGIRRGNLASNEAALKYFLLGAFATGFLLYGMTLVYGSTGSTNLFEIADFVKNPEAQSNPLLLMGLVLLIIGFGFKVASVPFHMWAPDVYQGAPTPVTAFMAVGPKAAAFAAFFRVFAEAFPEMAPSWEVLLSSIAVLSMFFGNLGAIMQTNIKRMLAFSSISHAGYILMAVIAKNSLGASSLLFYMLAYAFTTFGIFGIVILLGRKGEENLEIENYSGLAYKHPIIALSMTVFLLSLAGLPPFAGFIAKFYIFSAAVQEGLITLVIIAVLNSAISFYYYLKVVVFMYMKEPEAEFRISLTPLTLFVVFVGVIATVSLGIFPGSIIALASH
ncbi:MAG: NADH-quinone oxidoreductase subunit N [Nitrospina sp.]|nr:NADH-quinone oxidoreductase subunit N [Nitrospina sp.]MBT3856928.1 NADH-quinone oxidoreductase subunit N [Nitrospina sp.]MBT4103243.1 NADH-quinone oxidoreductase subunit N [Nitrospina sp.]MBT4390515.1 NADH-quinone oxidoreductase subunit N [Nitrospina sp.]MBT4620067.1 NADH-quinone oxidoreductase subunit N [Nitrospina sp.]